MWYVAPSTQKSTLTCRYAPPTIYWLKGKRGLNSVYKYKILALVTGVMTSAFLEVKLRPFIDCLNRYCIVVPGKPQAPPTYWFICQGEWHGKMKRIEEFTTFWSDFICKIVKGMRKISPYAIKMRPRLSQHTLLGSIHISLVSLRSLGRYFWPK